MDDESLGNEKTDIGALNKMIREEPALLAKTVVEAAATRRKAIELDAKTALREAEQRAAALEPGPSATDSLPIEPLLTWLGTNADAVAVIDALKEAGLLDRNATDQKVGTLFGIGGKDPSNALRQTRKKVTSGDLSPNHEKIQKLINGLSKHLPKSR